jgi:hypothetical protein
MDKEGSVKLEIEDRDEETGEENPNFIYSDEDEEAEPPPVLKRPKLKNEDIFRTPKVMAIAEPVKEKKKRKPPSQKQLDALAKARENMKLKREEAKKLKEEGKDVPKSKRQVNQEKQVKEVIQQQGQIYTQEEISKIVEQGIQKYDIQRKARKAVKQEQKQKDDQEAKVRQTLNRALGQPDPNDIWSRMRLSRNVCEWSLKFETSYKINVKWK